MSIFNFFRKKKSKHSAFTGDRVDYYWESAVEEYCEIHGIKRLDWNLDEMEDTTIWEYAGNHIAFFLI